MRISNRQGAGVTAGASTEITSTTDELTRQRALEALANLHGSEQTAEKIWDECCELAGLPSNRPESLEELGRVADQLSSRKGPIALIGSSLAIRVNTCRLLRQTQRLEAFLSKEPIHE